jgi:hypothetical protein
MLNDEVPNWLHGSPWTLCVKKEKVQSFDMAKGFVSNIQRQHMFYCKKITDTTIAHQKKSKSGVNRRANFDSWAECCLQWIIKNSHGNTLTKLSKRWQM